MDQLQNFSVQQAAAAAAVASAQNALQQPGDAQRLLMQRQVAADQLKRQFGNTPQGPGIPGNLLGSFCTLTDCFSWHTSFA